MLQNIIAPNKKNLCAQKRLKEVFRGLKTQKQVINEIKSLYRDKRIAKAGFGKDMIVVNTHPVVVHEFDYGCYQIQLDMGYSTEKVFNLTAFKQIEKTPIWHHWHVNSHGELCYGNAKTIISQLKSERNIVDTVHAIMELVYDNIDSGHQRYATVLRTILKKLRK